jgi:hypothetical protein
MDWARQKKGGQKMELDFRNLLKTHIEKMSVFRPAKMLMKTIDLWAYCQDADENKAVNKTLRAQCVRGLILASGRLEHRSWRIG